MEQMEEQKGISIIISTFNSEKYIGDCIDSILKQTYKNFEIVVVDDHSEDNIIDIIKGYAEKYPGKIVFKRNDTNCGVGYSKNQAVELAKYDYIAVIDSDAAVPEDWLEKACPHFEEADVFGGRYIPKCKTVFEKAVYALESFPEKATTFKKDEEPGIAGTNMFFKKGICVKEGGFDSSLRAGEDREFLKELLKKGYTINYYPELFVYHPVQNSLRNYLNREKAFCLWRLFIHKSCPKFKYTILPYVLITALIVVIAGLYYYSFWKTGLIVLVLIAILFLKRFYKLFWIRKNGFIVSFLAAFLRSITNLAEIKLILFNRQPPKYWK